MDVKINAKGQTTLFIVGGIVIVGLIALFLFYKGGLIPSLNFKQDTNPNSFFESCIEGKVKEATGLISSQGGYIENRLNINFKFDKWEKYRNISYLCYTQSYYVSCVNQEPMLIQHLKDEIENYIRDEVENCFRDYVSELKNQNYEVESFYDGFDVNLYPKRIRIDINGKITAMKTGEASKQDSFEIAVPTRFYDIASVAQEIISQEARFCNFETQGYMLFYPEFDIDRFVAGDSAKIYQIKHRNSNEEFVFAVRGCVIPPGV